MNQLALSSDLNVITAEINSYKQVAGQAIFEIGRRLKWVKENDLSHGEWSGWLENIGMDRSDANKYIRVVEELNESNVGMYPQIGLRALYLIATMPEEEREQLHTIPSTGEQKTVNEMTVRELQEVKKELQEAEQRANKAEQALLDRPEKIVLKEDKFKLELQQKEIDRLKSEADLLRRKAELNDQEAKKFAELKKQIEFLNREKTDLHRQIESATALSGLAVKIDHFLKTELAPIKYSRVLERLDSEVAVKNLKDILDAVDAWSEDIRRYLPTNRKIIEVIDQ